MDVEGGREHLNDKIHACTEYNWMNYITRRYNFDKIFIRP